VTLPAFETWEIRGVEGPRYKVGPHCANPSCHRHAEHAHHIVRRSQISGDYAWISVEGKILANLTGLCVPCHEDITGRVGGHKAAIKYIDGTFFYCPVEHARGKDIVLPGAPLRPQPPTPESLAEPSPSHDETESEVEPCPFCGREGPRRRRSTRPRVGRRRRKSWGIQVPDDQEDGADVLDSLVDSLAPVLDIEPSQTGRYFIVVPALVYAMQNLAEFQKAIRGTG
jgi:hypothetical protein